MDQIRYDEDIRKKRSRNNSNYINNASNASIIKEIDMKELNNEDRLLTVEAIKLLLNILEDSDEENAQLEFRKELNDLLERL